MRRASGAGIAIAVLTAGCVYDPTVPIRVDAVPADGAWFDDAGVPSCWIFDCPTDLGATVCGTCTNPGHELECPPGFLCSCDQACVKGPYSYDAAPGCTLDAAPDAGPGPDAAPAIDAREYDWPVCNHDHIPGT